MVNPAEEYERLLFKAIGPLNRSKFKDRETIYDDARRQLAGWLEPNKAGSEFKLDQLETVIRDTEKEIVALSNLHINKLASRAKLVCTLASLIIGTLYVAVQLKDISLFRILESVNPDYVFQIALTAYFGVIAAGFATDIETQKQVYVIDPNRGDIGRKAVLAISVYFITAALLAAASRNRIAFALAITLWHFSGIAFWKIPAHQLGPIFEESSKSANLRDDYYALEKLDLAKWYLVGNWHSLRHVILSALIILFDVLAISNFAEPYLANKAMIAGAPGVEAHLSTSVFVVYAAIGEGWTWVQRVSSRLSMITIERLERRYDLVKRAIGDFSDHGDLVPVVLPEI